MRIQAIADCLFGTDILLQKGIDMVHPGASEDDMTNADRKALYEIVFKCDTCGVWFPVDQASESCEPDQTCEYCCNE